MSAVLRVRLSPESRLSLQVCRVGGSGSQEVPGCGRVGSFPTTGTTVAAGNLTLGGGGPRVGPRSEGVCNKFAMPTRYGANKSTCPSFAQGEVLDDWHLRTENDFVGMRATSFDQIAIWRSQKFCRIQRPYWAEGGHGRCNLASHDSLTATLTPGKWARADMFKLCSRPLHKTERNRSSKNPDNVERRGAGIHQETMRQKRKNNFNARAHL